MKVHAHSFLEPQKFHSLALLDFFLSSDTSICFAMALPPFGNSDNVVLLASIELISKTSVDITYKHQEIIGYQFIKSICKSMKW